MVKISVIIPVYNCAYSIEHCIRSVQEQTLKELEVICIDDGSADESADIIEGFCRSDPRIKLIIQENQGAGQARNQGIICAKGEFVAFLDADDYYLEKDALEEMYLTCKKNKVPVCGTNIRIERGGILAEDRQFQKIMPLLLQKKVLSYREFQFDYGYCGFLFSRELISKNQILFPAYRRFEDPVFFVRAMYAAGRFCFIDKALYVYLAPSIMERFHAKNTVDLLRGLLDNLRFAASHDLKKLFVQTLERLDYEYAGVICHNIDADTLDIVDMLLEINRFVRTQVGNEDYISVPLQQILGNVSRNEEEQKEMIVKKLENCQRIYPYGAGKACNDFLFYLDRKNMLRKVDRIIVTEQKENPHYLEGIPLIGIEDYQFQSGDFVAVTVAGIYRKDVMQILKKHSVGNFAAVDAKVLEVSDD